MKSAVDQELIRLEKNFWNAVQNKDGSTASRLSDDLCVVIGPQGIGEVGKDDIGRMLEGATYELKKFSFDDREIHVRTVADNVAVVAYKVNEELIVDDKPQKLEAYDSSVWVRRDGKWLCALHTETLAGDPYGRDRTH